jgi:S1-C subfamily serine protease
VRIEALACGIGYTGTGWVVKPGIVVTAAHVVAGAKWVVITEPEEGKTVAATPIVFDGHNDLALLRAAPLAALPLPLGDAVQGSSGIALGYPAGGGFHAAAARIGETQNFLARDYRDSMVVRKITSIRADIRPGNSGGPLISRTGVVEGTVFARKQGDDVGYVVPTSVLRTDLAKPREPVSTGSCIG